MSHCIHQKATRPAAPSELFGIYLDSKTHGAAIDGRGSISRKAGTPLTAFNGGLNGRTLMIASPSWRNQW